MTPPQTAVPAPERAPVRDEMPLNGIHHVELYVGNAEQAAYFLKRAFGFRETAFAGLETGLRDRVSHVLEQGRIRLVVTGTMHGGNEIARHVADHGDGVKVIALSVPDTEHAYRYAVQHGARGLVEPYEASDDSGTVKLATIGTYGETVHTFVERNGYAGPFLPGFAPARADDTPDAGLLYGIDHIVGNVELGRMDEWVGYYERVFGYDRDDRVLRRRHRHRVQRADVQGGGRRQRPHQVPHQRAGRGQAQVADRGVPRVLRRRRRPAHRGLDDGHRRRRAAS